MQLFDLQKCYHRILTRSEVGHGARWAWKAVVTKLANRARVEDGGHKAV
jgi:hypothetical protein